MEECKKKFISYCHILHESTEKVLYPFKDKTRDIQSNITLFLKVFPRAKPKGTPEGKGLYLTVYPESSPYTDIISFLTIIRLMFTS